MSSTISFKDITSTTSTATTAMTDLHLTGHLMEKVSLLTNGAIHMDQKTTEPSIESMTVTEQAEEQPYPNFEVGPFEGVEKRLIVEFYVDALKASPLLRNGSLRTLSAAQWQSMLDKAACQILSYKELETDSGSCTAYLLSESSLFVYDHRVVLKTCGTTTPLLALPTLISFVVGSASRAASAVEVGAASVSECEQETSKPSKGGLQFDAMSLASRTTAETTSPTSRLVGITPPSQSISVDRCIDEESDESLSPRDALRNRHHTHSLMASPCQHSPLPSSCSSDVDESCSLVTTPNGAMSDDEMSTNSPIKSVISMPCLTPSISSTEADEELTPTKSDIAAAVQERADNDVTWIAVQTPRVVSWVLFSHLTYCFPEKQRYPHRSNDEEVEYLDQFCRQEGAAKQSVDVFSLRTSKNREFFVYAYNNQLSEIKANMVQEASKTPFIISELMMLGINEHCVDDFAGKGNGYNADLESTRKAAVVDIMKPSIEVESTKECEGINEKTLGSVLDQFWFSPCGYSCNALMEDQEIDGCGTLMAKPFGPHFATAHISPETESSYASLEVTFPFDLKKKSKKDEVTVSAKTTRKSTMFELCPTRALTTFNPRCVHVVEVELCGDRSGETLLGGMNQLNSTTASYELVDLKEYRGGWFHVRHSEYVRQSME